MHATLRKFQPTPETALAFTRIAFAICPTGAFCREDRCQSFFKFNLIPTLRAPLEDSEAAGAIRDAGATARVVDAPAGKMSPETFVSELRIFNPDLIIVVATFSTLEADLRWAEQLRQRFPKLPIGVRGAPCYVMDREILERSPAVDFCVRGEYELIFDNIVRAGFAGAPGVTYRESQKIVRSGQIPRAQDLDLLPRPDRSAIDPSLYTVRGFGGAQATVRVQRGCPFPCTYCLVHTVSGDKARHRSPQSIAEEVREIMDSGVSSIYLRAETFSLDRAWAMEVCEALRANCPGVKWVTTTRIERVDDELLAAMRASGCYGISFGIDVTSVEIARHVRKLAEREVAREVMRLCDKHGILSLAYLMIGFLWETEATVRAASEFVKFSRPDLLTVHFAHPYPGTRYYEDFQKSQKKVVSLRAQAEPALDTEGLSAKELQTKARRMLFAHYSRPSVLASLARKALPRFIGGG